MSNFFIFACLMALVRFIWRLDQIGVLDKAPTLCGIFESMKKLFKLFRLAYRMRNTTEAPSFTRVQFVRIKDSAIPFEPVAGIWLDQTKSIVIIPDAYATNSLARATLAHVLGEARDEVGFLMQEQGLSEWLSEMPEVVQRMSHIDGPDLLEPGQAERFVALRDVVDPSLANFVSNERFYVVELGPTHNSTSPKNDVLSLVGAVRKMSEDVKVIGPVVILAPNWDTLGSHMMTMFMVAMEFLGKRRVIVFYRSKPAWWVKWVEKLSRKPWYEVMAYAYSTGVL